MRLLSASCLALLILCGCKNVRFYEKEHLAEPVMRFEEDASESHFYQKTHYSMEGSAGGLGASAGGGCGCY